MKRQIIEDLPPFSRAWGSRLFEKRGGKLKIQQKFRRGRGIYEGLLCRQPGIDFIYQCATVLEGGLSLDEICTNTSVGCSSRIGSSFSGVALSVVFWEAAN